VTITIAASNESQASSLHCAGCNRAGRPPLIVYDRSKQDDAILTLRPAFVGERTMMLCQVCREKLRKRQGRRT
jgi:hypothetical protein